MSERRLSRRGVLAGLAGLAAAACAPLRLVHEGIIDFKRFRRVAVLVVGEDTPWLTEELKRLLRKESGFAEVIDPGGPVADCVLTVEIALVGAAKRKPAPRGRFKDDWDDDDWDDGGWDDGGWDDDDWDDDDWDDDGWDDDGWDDDGWDDDGWDDDGWDDDDDYEVRVRFWLQPVGESAILDGGRRRRSGDSPREALRAGLEAVAIHYLRPYRI